MEQLDIQNGDLVECIDVNGREDFLLLGGGFIKLSADLRKEGYT